MAFFRNRAQAAEELASLLPKQVGKDWLVLALPRGGVPIAAVLSRHLGAALDLVIVRKVGVPGNPELALAAVSGPGRTRMVLNDGLRDMLGLADEDIERLARPAVEEISRRRKLWSAPGLPLADRSVLLVDDGIATGTSMRAAIEAVRAQGARQIGLVSPVALGSSLQALPNDLAFTVCPYPSAGLSAVGAAYDDFPQVSDAEVARMLSESSVAERS
jgi:putative phosphoribosyl transferase